MRFGLDATEQDIELLAKKARPSLPLGATGRGLLKVPPGREDPRPSDQPRIMPDARSEG